MIGIIYREDKGLADAIQVANKTQKAAWILLRKMTYKNDRTIYWLIYT